MPDYPPKLFGIEEAEFGSFLNLSDGRRVPINIRPHRLAEAFAEYSRSLPALVAGRCLAVFADVLQTSQDEWPLISHLVKTAPATEAILRQHPIVWDSFRENYDTILSKPHRVYGGLEQGLYTSHPFQFRRDPNRPEPWRRALLSAAGGWLFEMWVELRARKVEIAAHVLKGHYVE